MAHPPAPVDPDEVRLSLAPFGESRMLPRAAYLEDDVLAWERRHLFSDWVCVGRAEGLLGPRSGQGGRRGRGVGAADPRLRRSAARLRERLSPPRSRDASLRRVLGRQAAGLPLPRVDLHPRRSAEAGARLSRGRRLRPVALLPQPDARARVARLGLGEPVGSERRSTAMSATSRAWWSPYDADDLVTVTTHAYDVAANWKLVVENYRSATTAPPSTPSCAGCRHREKSGENLEHRRRLGRRLDGPAWAAWRRCPSTAAAPGRRWPDCPTASRRR